MKRNVGKKRVCKSRTFFKVGGAVRKKGKNGSALEASKEGYAALGAMFQGRKNLPSSIMTVDKRTPTKEVDAPAESRSYTETSPYKNLRNKAFEISGRGCGSGALSTFPQNIGRSMVLMYSEPGDMVYDPHAGHNSRMDLCMLAGRSYTGCDISAEFMKFNKARAAELRELCPGLTVELHHCDSRKPPVKSNIGDFTITSPPYYDIEYYGDEEGQLGKAATYKEFLEGMQQVMNENFRILKPGKFAVYFINDFRRKGKMHFYHVDIMRMGQRAGFIAHDILIVDFGRSFRDVFINQTVEQKILPKRHEYGIVFKKPDEDNAPKKKKKKNG